MADFGYDVADYTDIHPMFGTLADFDRLLAEAHRRGLKLILDFVPNHTSDQHPWFLEVALVAGQPEARLVHLARPGAGRRAAQQLARRTSAAAAGSGTRRPASTTTTPSSRSSPTSTGAIPRSSRRCTTRMRFWLERGVDGFRVDVIWHLIKDDQFRDNPPNPGFEEGMWPYRRLLPVYTADRPEIHDVIAGLRRVVDEYDERVLIGEIYLPIERLVTYYGEDLRGAHLPFNFQLILTAWDARDIDRLIRDYEAALPAGGWPNWVLGNHDQHRIASRVGPAQARVAAMLLLTLRGTPTLYYGDEIGMRDVPIPPERVQDPCEKRDPRARPRARSRAHADAVERRAATPASPTARPGCRWRRTSPRSTSRRERGDPSSMLSLYRALIELRRSEPALAVGDYAPLAAEGPVLAYRRRARRRGSS